MKRIYLMLLAVVMAVCAVCFTSCNDTAGGQDTMDSSTDTSNVDVPIEEAPGAVLEEGAIYSIRINEEETYEKGALTADKFGTEDNSLVKINKYQKSLSQLWRVYKNEDGTYGLENMASLMKLSLRNPESMQKEKKLSVCLEGTNDTGKSWKILSLDGTLEKCVLINSYSGNAATGYASKNTGTIYAQQDKYEADKNTQKWTFVKESDGKGEYPYVLVLKGDFTGASSCPEILYYNGVYYNYNMTGPIALKTSTDLITWTRHPDKNALSARPSWLASVSGTNEIWAPGAYQIGDKYYLYYCTSDSGSQNSAIGVAVSTDPSKNDWQDLGLVIRSYDDVSKYNCIDPNVFIDTDGTPYLIWGSYWEGIYMRKIDADTGKLDETDTTLYHLAKGNGDMEAPYLIKHGDYYYLFTARGGLKKGTYYWAVGRSKTLTGPYVDQRGVELLQGGGLRLTEWKDGIEGIYQPGNKFADENGIRRDVLDLVKKQGVSIVRYPGGNFVSAYHWENTVGPKSERKTMIEPAWRSIDTNEFGLNEFMDWSKLADIEPMMAINLGTRGVDAAIHLLEYCNHPGGTYYSDLRRKHGYEKPHNIKFWCLGNEMDGPWQIGHKPADEYGRLAWQAGKVMKMINPDLELAVCGSAGSVLPTFGSWDATVVEETYDICDYLSMHAYYDNRNKTPDDTRTFFGSGVAFERQIEDVIACCDYVRAKKKKQKKINISIDEWNVVYRPHGKVPPIDWEQASHEIEDVYCMEDVIVVGNCLIAMLKHADRVKVGCQAQLVNVISPIMTSDNGAWMQTIYYPFAHCAEYGQGKSIKLIFDCESYETKKHGEVPYLDGALVENEEKEQLTLFCINRDLDEAHSLDIDLRQYEGYKIDKHIVVNHDNLRAVNTEEAPFTVVPREDGISTLDAGKLNAVLEAHSWNVIVMKKA